MKKYRHETVAGIFVLVGQQGSLSDQADRSLNVRYSRELTRGSARCTQSPSRG
jgi:hypothetical protein